LGPDLEVTALAKIATAHVGFRATGIPLIQDIGSMRRTCGWFYTAPVTVLPTRGPVLGVRKPDARSRKTSEGAWPWGL